MVTLLRAQVAALRKQFALVPQVASNLEAVKLRESRSLALRIRHLAATGARERDSICIRAPDAEDSRDNGQARRGDPQS